MRATARAELSTAVTAAAPPRAAAREKPPGVGVAVEHPGAARQRPDPRPRLALVDEHAGLLPDERLDLELDAVLEAPGSVARDAPRATREPAAKPSSSA